MRAVTAKIIGGGALQLSLPDLPGSIGIHGAAIEAALPADLRFLRPISESPDVIEVEPREGAWAGDGGRWPWLSPGYVGEEVLPWVTGHIGPLAEVSTLHASGRSLVLALTGQRGERHYFKADASSEAAMVSVLSPWAGQVIPHAVAADRARGWLLRADFGGVLLEDLEDAADWAEAAATLGRLQRVLEAAVPELLEQARDYRGEKLAAALTAMVADQPASLTAYTADCCAVLRGSVAPPTAVHQDFVACNVVKTAAGFRIFDWSDVVVGHPFFACDRLLDACWSDVDRKRLIIDAYLTAWTDLAPLSALQAEFAACQKLRVLYEDLRWTDELAGLPPASPMRKRLAADRAAGLAMVVEWLARR